MADAMRLLRMVADLDNEERLKIKFVVSEGCVYAMTLLQYLDMLVAQTNYVPLDPMRFGGAHIGWLELTSGERVDLDDINQRLARAYREQSDEERRRLLRESREFRFQGPPGTLRVETDKGVVELQPGDMLVQGKDGVHVVKCKECAGDPPETFCAACNGAIRDEDATSTNGSGKVFHLRCYKNVSG